MTSEEITLFRKQLGGELRKLFARKRTYIGFGAFLALEVVVLFLLRLPKAKAAIRHLIDGAGYDPGDYFSGLTLGLMIMSWTVFLLGALYLALVGGDVVSKEVEDGTMRMMLCRPISRGRILLLKAVACAVYSVALTVFITVTALLAGFLYGGFGGLFAFYPAEHVFALYDFWPGLWRYLLAIPLLGLSLFTVSCIAFLFSCMKMKPASATIITLSVLFLDSVVRNIPFFTSYQGWFFTARMATWIHVFDYAIPWEKMVENYVLLGAMNITLLVIGWMIFEQRDFKS